MFHEGDTIMVNVVGTEGQSRATSRVSGRFNHEGVAINEQGRATGEPALDLSTIRATGTTTAIPEFPADQMKALQRAGDLAGVKALNLAYQRQIADLQTTGAGVGQAGFYTAVAKSVIAWLKRYHDWDDADNGGRKFVLKPENVEISAMKVNGATVFVVAGTAVFGR